MYALDCGSTGAAEMSTFHQLSSGNSRRPPKSSMSCTPVDDEPPGPGSPDGSDDGLAGPPPHAMHTRNTAPQNDAEPECRDEKARRACTGNRRIRKIGTGGCHG